MAVEYYQKNTRGGGFGLGTRSAVGILGLVHDDGTDGVNVYMRIYAVGELENVDGTWQAVAEYTDDTKLTLRTFTSITEASVMAGWMLMGVASWATHTQPDASTVYEAAAGMDVDGTKTLSQIALYFAPA